MKTSPSVAGLQARSVFVSSIALTIALCWMISISPVQLQAQALSGMNGTVTDSSGAVVSGATVMVTNDATGVVTKTTTTSAGTYSVTDLIPGTYTVRVEGPGFQAGVLNGVYVDVARRSTANLVLKPGSASEKVEVKANAITLETDQPQLATTVEPRLVAELPNEFGNDIGARGRQIDNFIVLTPGVTGGSFSHRINGGVDFQNEIVFNGIPVAQSETQGLQTNINPPYELVSQFSVLNSVFSAQYGLGQGVAQYQFASGSNKLHGDAFEILRNDYFDAPGVAPNNPGRPNPDKEHNFGFSFGGPVYIPHVYDGRNKTFFYASLEWYRLTNAQSGFMTMPTAAEKAGDFSAVGDNIFVPSTFVPPAGCNVTPGAQFPGNVIPKACFSPASAAILPVLPDPTIPGLTNNLQSQINKLFTKQASWGFNIDHNLTRAQTLHFTFWRDSYNQPNCCDNHALFDASSPLSGLKQEPRLGTGIFLTYSNALSNHLVVTAGMGWMGEINNELNVHPGYSFPGIVGGTVFPTIDFGCGGGSNCPAQKPNNLGAGNGGEPFSNNRKLGLSWANNYLYTHGRHTLNFGWEARRTYQDDQECQYCTGLVNFSFLTTSNGVDSTTGNGFASFLLGEVDSVDRRFAIEQKLRNLYFAPYIQDNIKITPKFTLDVGIRWDIMRPFTDIGNNIVFFQPNLPNPGAINPAGQPLLGAVSKFGNCDGCAGTNHGEIDWHQFSPRIGITYALTPKTVVLAGFALNHLDGGMFEYGTNKVAVNFGNLLAGVVQVPSANSTVPGYGSWDTTPIAAPGVTPFSPTMGNASNVNALALNNGRAPYNEAWNVGVQRELPWGTFLSASYVANRGIHLPSQLNPFNQINPSFLSLCTPGSASCVLGSPFTDPAAQAVLAANGFGQCAGVYMPYCNFGTDFPSSGSGNLQRALLPYPQFNSIFNNFETSGSSLYNSLQTQVQKRFNNGVTFLVNYTLSRMMSNTNSGFTSFASTALNKFNQKAEWTIDNNDQTHVVNISGVYELPFGPGKPFLNHGGTMAKNLVGGWQISGILTYSSGTLAGPNAITANGDPLGAGAGNRTDIVPGTPLRVNWDNYHRGLPVFNVAAFSDPGQWTLGDSPRVIGALRNPRNENENIALGKHFYFGERVSAEIRMEFFNIFNRAQICGFGNTDTNVSDGAGSFGYDSIQSPGVPAPCQGNTPRHGQAFFKITF